MARKINSEFDRVVANIVTVADIAARCGVSNDTVEEWRSRGWPGGYGFPGPVLPTAAGAGSAWWWPDVWAFIDRNRGELAKAMPLLEAAVPVPLPHRRGAPPGPRILDPFSIGQIRAMRAQVDDQGRPRYTARQIASSLPYPVNVSTIHMHAPAPAGHQGRLGGRDLRALPPAKVAELRALRALTQDGKPVHTLGELAARPGVTNMTVSRYCRDIVVGTTGESRRRRTPIAVTGDDGQTLTSEQVRQVQALCAERDDEGVHRYTREQIAGMTGIPAETVGLLARGLTWQPARSRQEPTPATPASFARRTPSSRAQASTPASSQILSRAPAPDREAEM
jgi:hypothetical protein